MYYSSIPSKSCCIYEKLPSFFSFLFVVSAFLFIYFAHSATKNRPGTDLILKQKSLMFEGTWFDLAHKIWYFAEKCTGLIHYDICIYKRQALKNRDHL